MIRILILLLLPIFSHSSPYGIWERDEAEYLKKQLGSFLNTVFLYKESHRPYFSIVRLENVELYKNDSHGGVKLRGEKLFFGELERNQQSGNLVIDTQLYRYFDYKIKHGRSYSGDSFRQVINVDDLYIQIERNVFIKYSKYVKDKGAPFNIYMGHQREFVIHFSDDLFEKLGYLFVQSHRSDGSWLEYRGGYDDYVKSNRPVDIFSPVIPESSIKTPSFSCEKSRTKIEYAICGNKELSRLDGLLSVIYTSVKKQMEVDGLFETFKKKEFIKRQRDWIKGRNARCEKDDSIHCLRAEYYRRLNELRSNELLFELFML